MSFQAQPWMALAACGTVDPEIFFSIDGASGPLHEAREAKAKAVCAGCPVTPECLSWALTFPAQHGVAGGYGEDERQGMRHAWLKRQQRQERAA